VTRALRGFFVTVKIENQKGSCHMLDISATAPRVKPRSGWQVRCGQSCLDGKNGVMLCAQWCEEP
jgi:hypothetical protein